ncbi:hypothetical protein IFM89_009752 [Coptis chinensis]|uniref:F-box domain-containing protein n=1 Tax=Coptis chinensis TaxID=261450 RepID=A0A835HZ63_9MAGN|nr:hypothetical protein IFM89_009752 [Coptis chinensis]
MGQDGEISLDGEYTTGVCTGDKKKDTHGNHFLQRGKMESVQQVFVLEMKASVCIGNENKVTLPPELITDILSRLPVEDVL